jgi:hypothetical protein
VEFGGQVHDWLVRTGRGNNDGFGRESVSVRICGGEGRETLSP